MSKIKNISYRNQGYAEGYADGTNNTGEIVYTYHTHVDSCYQTKKDSIKSYANVGYQDRYCCGSSGTVAHACYTYPQLASGKSYPFITACGSCGILKYYTEIPTNETYYTVPNYTLTLGTYKVVVCGKTTSTIESATITFKEK